MSRPLIDGDFPSEHATTRRRTTALERRPQDIVAHYEIKVFGDAQAVSTGNGKFIFSIPIGVGKSALQYGVQTRVLLRISAYVTTVSSSGLVTVMLRNVTQAVDMLTTAVTIDANEFSSNNAATPSVIDQDNLEVNVDDLLAIDVDTAGTGAKGLGVIAEFGDGTRDLLGEA
jgi:hypothetical protein